jgi:hypothetical protein
MIEADEQELFDLGVAFGLGCGLGRVHTVALGLRHRGKL